MLTRGVHCWSISLDRFHTSHNLTPDPAFRPTTGAISLEGESTYHGVYILLTQGRLIQYPQTVCPLNRVNHFQSAAKLAPAYPLP